MLDENIMKDIDAEKVGNSFGMFVLSKTEPEQIVEYLDDFKLMFRDLLMKKSKETIPTTTDDDIVNQHNSIEVNREVERQTSRSMLDLETWVNKISYDWKDFFKGLVNEI